MLSEKKEKRSNQRNVTGKFEVLAQLELTYMKNEIYQTLTECKLYIYRLVHEHVDTILIFF